MAQRIIGYSPDGDPIYQDTATGTSSVDRTNSQDANAGQPSGADNTNRYGGTGQQTTPAGGQPAATPRYDEKNKWYVGPDGNYYVDAAMTKRVGAKAPTDPYANTAPMPDRPTTGMPAESKERGYRESVYGNNGGGAPQADPSRADAAPEMGAGFQDWMAQSGIKMPSEPAFDFAKYLGPAEQVFRQELDRLSRNDPFGNQAFLQKATDRAIGVAAGQAAGARGGPGAVGGAFRQAQGIQSQLAAEGAQEMATLKQEDERQAQAGRLGAAQGLAGLAQTGVQAGITQDQQAIDAFSTNIQAALGFEGLTQNERRGLEQLDLAYKQMDQNERLALQQVAVEFQKIDAQLYQTDMNYRAQVDANLMQKYGIDKQFEMGVKQINAQGSLTFKDIVLGTLNAGGQVAGAVAAKSDRRAKFDISEIGMEEIRDYLGKTRGFSYKYKNPKDGKGTNFGPMAQDLKATKLGKASVIEGSDGLYVDTRRLALTDHAVLAKMFEEVEALKKDLK